MSLNELHARRLATVFTVLDGALNRIELLMRSIGTLEDSPGFSADQIRAVREKMDRIRNRIKAARGRFSIRPQKPPARQVLAAELSALWVVLENAMPARMKGYGREFDAADQTDWERLIRGLLNDVEQLRAIALCEKSEFGRSEFRSTPD